MESAMFQALSLTFQSCRPISFLLALANPHAARDPSVTTAAVFFLPELNTSALQLETAALATDGSRAA